jgi:hypothetical protein
MVVAHASFSGGNRAQCNGGVATMRKLLIAAVLLALATVSLVHAGTKAMGLAPADLRPAAAMSAIGDMVALRKGDRLARPHAAAGTRHVTGRHRAVAKNRHIARAHRRVALKTRHAAVRHRVAARTRHVAVRHRRVAARTRVAALKPGAAALASTAVARPVRPWFPQPYYGAIIAGVTLGTVVAANTVPPSPSFDLCWYWSNTAKTRGYWDFCH